MEGTVPVLSLDPPLRFAVVCYYLFRGHRNWGLQKWRGQTKGEAPWNVMNWC